MTFLHNTLHHDHEMLRELPYSSTHHSAIVVFTCSTKIQKAESGMGYKKLLTWSHTHTHTHSHIHVHICL